MINTASQTSAAQAVSRGLCCCNSTTEMFTPWAAGHQEQEQLKHQAPAVWWEAGSAFIQLWTHGFYTTVCGRDSAGQGFLCDNKSAHDPPVAILVTWGLLYPRASLNRSKEQAYFLGSKASMGGGTCAYTGICIFPSQIFAITIPNLG